MRGREDLEGAVVAPAAEQLGPPAGWVAAVDVEGVAPQSFDAHPHPGVPHAQRLVRRGREQQPKTAKGRRVG